MAKLRFQIAATNYVLKDSTADNLNFLAGSDRDKFQIEWSGGLPVGFPYGLGAGDLVLVDITDAGYNLDGGSSVREFYVTDPDLSPALDAIELSWYPFRRLPLSNAPPAGSPTYPFYVNEPAFTEFFPTLDSYDIDYTKQDDEIFFRKQFEGNFLVSQKTDYEFLKDLRDSDFKYRIFVKIQRLCSGSYVDEIEGFFTVAQCIFNLDKCTVQFPIYTTDKYERILNRESFEINIQNISNKYTAQFLGTTYKNAMKLGDVLTHLLTKYAPQIKEVRSVFFDIDSPADFVYDANMDIGLVNNILIYAPSDFRFPAAASPATITNVTLTQILESLRILFSAYWFIVDGVLRIEHFEYFLQTSTDLSGKTRIARDIRQIDTTKLPIAQRFKVKENYALPYGRGFLINWDDQIKYLNSGGTVEELRADSVTTDVVWYSSFGGAPIGSTAFPEPDLTAGFIIYNPKQTTLLNPPDFDQNTQLLSWDILLKNFFIFDVVGSSYVGRTASTGGTDFEQEVYEILTNIQSRRERNIVEGLVFDNCCDSFDPVFKVITTEFGNVRISERATHNLRNDTLKTDVKF